jgi:hypothetical protein
MTIVNSNEFVLIDHLRSHFNYGMMRWTEMEDSNIPPISELFYNYPIEHLLD